MAGSRGRNRRAHTINLQEQWLWPSCCDWPSLAAIFDLDCTPWAGQPWRPCVLAAKAGGRLYRGACRRRYPACDPRRAGAAEPLPFLPVVQRSFGTTDIAGHRCADAAPRRSPPSREDVRAGKLVIVLPITALLPHRQGLLRSVGAFVDHIAAEFPKVVLL